MNRTRIRCAGIALAICVGLVVSASGVPAIVLTNTGERAEGALIGLAPTLRLQRPFDVPFVGPDMQFDVPLSSILQITLDFPRVIIETAARTLIGPFSAISGLPEVLNLDLGGSGTREFATAALRAIALNGSGLRSVPREWMGSGFLTEPEVTVSSAITDAACGDCAITTSTISGTDAGDTPIWNTITPSFQPEEPASAIPWWVGLLGVAGLVGLFYILSTSSSS
jgi:hypothetical protein